MKQNIKRVFLLLCTLCLLSITACSMQSETVETLDPMIVSGMDQAATSTLEQLSQMTPEQIQANLEGAQKQGDAVVAAAMQSWESIRDDLGSLVSISSVQVSVNENDEYIAVVQAKFEKRNMEMRMGLTEDRTAYSLLSFNPEYTLLEKMSKAFMNMMMGMGTVFAVLIFISLLISCFKYISVWENRAKNKAADVQKEAPAVSAPADGADVPTEVFPDEDLTDDMELVAVITAAIAAAGQTSADGLVVRSIRRVSPSKWKRA